MFSWKHRVYRKFFFHFSNKKIEKIFVDILLKDTCNNFRVSKLVKMKPFTTGILNSVFSQKTVSSICGVSGLSAKLLVLYYIILLNANLKIDRR